MLKCYIAIKFYSFLGLYLLTFRCRDKMATILHNTYQISIFQWNQKFSVMCSQMSQLRISPSTLVKIMAMLLSCSPCRWDNALRCRLQHAIAANVYPQAMFLLHACNTLTSNMATIVQTTPFNVFSWHKILTFRLNVHTRWFLIEQLKCPL